MNLLVIGGSGGIGGAVTRLLRSENPAVYFTYKTNLAKAAELEKATGAEKIYYDFSSDDSIAELLEFISSNSLDGLVYAAAEKLTREAILKMPVKIFLEYVSKSVKGYYQVSQAFALSVKNRKAAGSIVNVLSSVVLGLPPAKQAGYVCSKYALLGLMKSQAVEFASFNVRINAVSPGMTKTAFNSDLPDRFIEIYAESLPMRRLVTPEEVAQVVRFLLSSEASYLQGVNIPIGGGLVC